MNQNPLAKFMQKLENEMLITVVDWQLNDSSYAASPFSTKADSSCYQSTVKSGDTALVFHILFHHGKHVENVVDAFDCLWELPLFMAESMAQ